LSDPSSSSPKSGNPGNSGSGGSGGTGATGGFAAGIGASGQNSAAQFLYSAPLPGGAPFATKINQQNGTLTTSANQASASDVDPVNIAIDPSGSFLYEATSFSPGGLFGFTIDRQTGSLTTMANSPFSANQNFYSVAIDPLGKFLYAEGSTQIFAYAIQSGTGELTPVPGSPFAAAGPSNPRRTPRLGAPVIRHTRLSSSTSGETMAALIHEHSTRVKGADGTRYVVRIYGQERTDGTWEGWLEFHPTDERKSVLRTEQETSQPDRNAVEYWASGLDSVYIEGAFARAQGRLL